jgi:hypothetical protein
MISRPGPGDHLGTNAADFLSPSQVHLSFAAQPLRCSNRSRRSLPGAFIERNRRLGCVYRAYSDRLGPLWPRRAAWADRGKPFCVSNLVRTGRLCGRPGGEDFRPKCAGDVPIGLPDTHGMPPEKPIVCRMSGFHRNTLPARHSPRARLSLHAAGEHARAINVKRMGIGRFPVLTAVNRE